MNAPATGDRFEAWLRAPLGGFEERPGYEVHRARPEHFDAIYDLVDEGLGVVRPRRRYDWLYRENPAGPAECFVVRDATTGELVAASGYFPWPAAIGDQPVRGVLSGDAVVRRGLRGRGLDKLHRAAWRSHPARKETVTVGWPNADSARHIRQQGLKGMLAGPLRRVVLPLDGRARSRSRSTRRGFRVEPVRRFDERFEPVAARCLRIDGVWFPRSRALLEWRYHDHPEREYHALAVLRGDEVSGFCIVNLDGSRATLMELAAPVATEESTALLDAAAGVVRDAGCQRLVFFATTGFGQWSPLEAAGFVPARSEKLAFLDRFGAPDSDQAQWSVTPAEDEVL